MKKMIQEIMMMTVFLGKKSFHLLAQIGERKHHIITKVKLNQLLQLLLKKNDFIYIISFIIIY
jgi:hypothetical protein